MIGMRLPYKFIRTFSGKVALVMAGLFIATVTLAYSITVAHKIPTSPIQTHSSETRGYWTERIEEIGAERAYAEFANSMTDIAPIKQHTASHEFGAALYTVFGFEGIKTCDNRFLWGCFHEVMGETLAAHGLSVITDLQKICDGFSELQADACRHSIGHGLLAWFGYSDKNLEQALEACSSYITGSANNTLGGCYSGVFMEFTLRTMGAPEGQNYKVDSPTQYYSICYGLSAEFRTTCAAQAIQSWILSTHEFSREAFFKFGELCRGFNSPLFVDYCYTGLGNHLPTDKSLSASEVIARCKAAAPSERGSLLCRSSSAAISLALNGQPSVDICDDLTGWAQEYCNEYATGSADYRLMVDDLHLHEHSGQ